MLMIRVNYTLYPLLKSLLYIKTNFTIYTYPHQCISKLFVEVLGESAGVWWLKKMRVRVR